MSRSQIVVSRLTKQINVLTCVQRGYPPTAGGAFAKVRPETIHCMAALLCCCAVLVYTAFLNTTFTGGMTQSVPSSSSALTSSIM